MINFGRLKVWKAQQHYNNFISLFQPWFLGRQIIAWVPEPESVWALRQRSWLLFQRRSGGAQYWLRSRWWYWFLCGRGMGPADWSGNTKVLETVYSAFGARLDNHYCHIMYLNIPSSVACIAHHLVALISYLQSDMFDSLPLFFGLHFGDTLIFAGTRRCDMRQQSWPIFTLYIYVYHMMILIYIVKYTIF